jgi:hypothetical protein
MGRGKEKGKPVADLTPDELQKELVRCRGFLVYLTPNSAARKRLQKRVRELEAELAARS